MKNSKNLREFEQMAVDLGFNPLSFLPFENDLGWRLLVSCPKTNCRYYLYPDGRYQIIGSVMTPSYFDQVKTLWLEVFDMMHDNKITFIQYKNASKLHNNALMPDSKPVDYHFFRAYVNQLKNGIRNDNC